MVNTGNSDAFFVQISALSAGRSEELFRYRLVDDSHLQFSGVFKSDRDCKTRIAMGKIGSAVERIDDPAIACIAFVPTAFFRYYRVLREIASQPAYNRLFRPPVGLRNKIYFPLVADLRGAIELGYQDAAGFYGRLNCHFQKLIAHSSGVCRLQLAGPPL